MSNATMYDLSLAQTVNLIVVGGHERTVYAQGHMGNGKTSMLGMCHAALPKHIPCYFDCTTKDLGDVTVPDLIHMDDGSGFVRYLTNEELGIHNNKPIILLIDEYGKANAAVKNALLRLMLERQLGSYKLHPDSKVFVTSNLGAEGVGDMLPAHACDRITLVNIRKSTPEEWIAWGVNHDVDVSVLGFVREFPQILQSFEDVKDPADNPYIFHPREKRTKFVTPRGLEAASDWLKKRDLLDSTTMTAALVGSIGFRGAMDLMTFVTMADQIPTRQEIQDSPQSAKVPVSSAAVCMVVYRALATTDNTNINSWMDYLSRLDVEAQSVFVNGVRAKDYDSKRQQVVMSNKKFTDWAIANHHLFTTDKV
jgi:hypothetical protein